MILGVAFTTLAYPHLDLVDVVERYKRFGFDALELRVADDGKHLRPVYPLPRDVIEILRDVRVCSLAGYARFAYKGEEELSRNIDLAKRLINIASDLGARGVRVYIGHFEGDPEIVLSKAAQAINSIADFAEDRGVYIMVETHDSVAFYKTMHILLSYLDNRIKILYDPANVLRAGEDLDKYFELVKNRVAHVHLKDFKYVENKPRYTLPGEGVVPIKRIIEKLVSSNYAGYISIEWEKMWHPDLEDSDAVLPKYLNYVREILRTIV